MSLEENPYVPYTGKLVDVKLEAAGERAIKTFKVVLDNEEEKFIHKPGQTGMLGVLGTVIGMIIAFYDMSMAGNNIDIALLSTGIYQAMITTVGVLIVGILAYVCYNILVARIEKLVYLLEARTTEFMDLLNEPA